MDLSKLDDALVAAYTKQAKYQNGWNFKELKEDIYKTCNKFYNIQVNSNK